MLDNKGNKYDNKDEVVIFCGYKWFVRVFTIYDDREIGGICSMDEKQCSLDMSVVVVEKNSYPRISVIVPARNEARNLYHVLPHIPSMVEEVILVDGHSVDNTIGVALQLLPSIHIVKQNGIGKGDALRAGFAACTGHIIITLDADGSADPREIPQFVEALIAGHDFAKGSRFVEGGGSHDITFVRYLGNYLLSMLVNVLFFARFSDLCYGYNAFWRYCLKDLVIECDGFEIETLINLQMYKARFKIVEVPSFEHPRVHGKSNLRTFHDGWRILKTILRERVYARSVIYKQNIALVYTETREE